MMPGSSKRRSLRRQRQHSRMLANNNIAELKEEFSERSTLHGISDLYSAQHWLMRTVWLILIFCAMIGAIYGTYKIFVDFQKSPVVVSYFVHEQTDKGMQLPDLIVCPFNRFNKTILEQHQIRGELAQYLELAFLSPTIHDFQLKQRQELNAANKTAELDRLLKEVLRRHNYTFTSFVNSAMLTCEDVIKSGCHNVNMSITSAGRCFRIQGNKQTAPGFGYGNRVIVSLPNEVYVPGVNQILVDGIALKLAEQNKGIGPDLLFVPAGVHAIVTLKATKYEFMNDPPRYSCDHTVNESYSDLRCFENCIIEPIEPVRTILLYCIHDYAWLQRCNCSLVASPEPRFEYCTWLQISTCIFQHFGMVNETACRKRCKPPCAYVDYQASVTYGTFPPPTITHFLKSEAEIEELKSHIILEVFFERMEILFIRHVVSMTPFSFIAQIGGQVSLWVGGSILTCVQLLVFLVKFAHYHTACLLCNNSSGSSTHSNASSNNNNNNNNNTVSPNNNHSNNGNTNNTNNNLEGTPGSPAVPQLSVLNHAETHTITYPLKYTCLPNGGLPRPSQPNRTPSFASTNSCDSYHL